MHPYINLPQQHFVFRSYKKLEKKLLFLGTEQQAYFTHFELHKRHKISLQTGTLFFKCQIFMQSPILEVEVPPFLLLCFLHFSYICPHIAHLQVFLLSFKNHSSVSIADCHTLWIPPGGVLTF